MGTVAAERGRGVGRLLTLAPLHAASSPVAGFWSTPDGSRLYRKLGFRAAGWTTRWLWRPDALAGLAQAAATARGGAR